MVVLASSITASTGMLAMLANTTVASADVTALLTVLLEACRLCEVSSQSSAGNLSRNYA